MNSRERILAALNLNQPDRVPFADWVDDGIRAKLVHAMGFDEMDEAQFAKGIGFDAIGFQGLYYAAPVCDETATDDQGKKHYLGRGLIKDEDDLDRMAFPDPRDEKLYEAPTASPTSAGSKTCWPWQKRSKNTVIIP